MAKSWEDLITDEKASEQVVSMAQYIHKLETQIRLIRDLRGDDRCWWSDLENLYKLLPEGYTPPERDETVELELCKQYIASCHNPSVSYVSPQRRIEELERELGYANMQITQLELERSGGWLKH